MQVTSETLFHFTTSLKNLQNILLKKFNLTYCNEKFTLNNENQDYYFPMISFCDIPLSLAKDQIDKYGPYAIGLTKEWGIRNKLNPIVYLEKNSLLAQDIQEDIDRLFKLVEGIKSTDKKNILYHLTQISSRISNFSKAKSIITSSEKNALHVEALTDVLKLLDDAIPTLTTCSNIWGHFTDLIYSKLNFYRYIKNYQGPLFRPNKSIDEYRFYDEREWRYVPAINDKRIEPKLNEEQYKKYRGTAVSKH
jgi:hypothetical protein